MPDGGTAGYYSDWYNFGDYGTPMWETFHNDLLIPWIDGNFRTIAEREGRAVAGASMGGYGALANAARHPDLYGATASFSGAVDLNNPALENLTLVAGVSDGKKQLGSIFGYKQSDEVRWRGNNPWDLAANLANTDVSLYTRNGLPGGPNGNSELDLEVVIHQANVSMHDQLLRLGIPHRWSDYGPGNHAWYYFNRSFRQWLPHLMSYFEQYNGTPQSFVFSSIKETYERFEWSVSMQRPAVEFSALDVASPNRFSVAGSGTATVSTAPLYRAKAWYRVTTSGIGGSEQHLLQADSTGRLTMKISLGPGNPHQQYTPEAATHDTLTCATRLDVGDITHIPFMVVGDGCSFYRTAVTVSRI